MKVSYFNINVATCRHCATNMYIEYLLYLCCKFNDDDDAFVKSETGLGWSTTHGHRCLYLC